MTILDEIITYKKREVMIAKANTPLSALSVLATEAGAVRPFRAAVEKKAATGAALIAEIKKASPSKGVIREDFDPLSHAIAYEAGGAACLSVLTDGPSFQGSRDHLRTARAACRLPVLRKDFMIDPYQVTEARAWGADCILLIAACLSDDQIIEMSAAAESHGMDFLLEVHDAPELDRALKVGAKLIGINNRNLKTFETSIEATINLAQRVPSDRLIVSESGISTNRDIETLASHGVRSFLVGEALMRADDVAAATRALLGGSDLA